MEVEEITYDAERDLLEVWFVPAGPVAETRPGDKGATVDYDADGNLVVIRVPKATDFFDGIADPATLIRGPYGHGTSPALESGR